MHRAIQDRRRRLPRWTALALLAPLALASLSGCVRLHGGLAVNQDDLISGEVIVASVATRQNDPGPLGESPNIPQELSAKVRVEKYTADGYVGHKLNFTDLTFTDVALLADSITATKQYRLTFRRSGDLVSMAGSIDLTQVPTERADVRLKIAFPGTITRTNGLNDSGQISWEPKPGAVTEFNATAQYTDTSGVSWTRWVLIVGAAAVGVALIVLLLALIAHRRTLRQISAERAQAR